MSNNVSENLKKNINRIMGIWEERANLEIQASKHQGHVALRNSLSEYLAQLADDLSKTIDRTAARKKSDKNESTRLGKKHGKERAGSINYTLDQLIMEYHILRQVICDVLEEDKILTPVEREVIVGSIEQAVNDAATEFSKTLKNLQDQISFTLAHDLRNPMSAAKISAQLILKSPDDKNKNIESANRITRSMDRIDKMISELLDASRMSAGESPPLEFKECDLDWLAKDVAYELNIDQRNRLIVQSSGKCLGSWNEDGLRRILENLAANAIKYGEKDTPITISIIQDELSAKIIVHNEGAPIPPEELSILFETFKRSATSENKIGWGLGLSVVKAMVDLHKGTINVKSEKDKGTTFTISLPKVHQEVSPFIGKKPESLDASVVV